MKIEHVAAYIPVVARGHSTLGCSRCIPTSTTAHLKEQQVVDTTCRGQGAESSGTRRNRCAPLPSFPVMPCGVALVADRSVERPYYETTGAIQYSQPHTGGECKPKNLAVAIRKGGSIRVAGAIQSEKRANRVAAHVRDAVRQIVQMALRQMDCLTSASRKLLCTHC